VNHLAHFALAGRDPALLVGGFLGDYVKGRLTGRFPAEIERGIRLHRAIDRFTDEHPVTRISAKRLPRRFHRYGGIITDITYDHLLAVNWQQYYDTSLNEFSRYALSKLLEYRDHLPEDALKTAIRMHELNSLAGYSELAFIERSLGYLSTRLTRDNPLDEAAIEVTRHLDSMTGDLARFYPELRVFCDEWRQNH
jgi:acyl carrier protein phosphodiesterase